MNKKVKLIIEITLVIAIVVLSVVIYNSVQNDIDFESEKLRKTELISKKLKDIREIQFAYELKNNSYASTWEQLIQFAKTDSLEFTRRIGDLEDSAEVASGRAYTEKVYISVIQKLQEDNVLSKNFSLDSMKYIPESDSIFSIKSSKIMSGGQEMPTFEIGASWDVILQGLDKQLIINLKSNFKKRTGFPGLRIGKLEEASTEGNW